jgi:hypothetical protein
MPGAKPSELKLTYDEVRNVRTFSSKGVGLLDAVFYEVLLYGEAMGQDSEPAAFELRYTRTQVVQNASTEVRSITPQDTPLYILADTTRFVLRPTNYQTRNDPSLAGLQGYYQEILTYPASDSLLWALATAKRIRAKAGEEDVRFNMAKVGKGAQAVLIGRACGWPESRE